MAKIPTGNFHFIHYGYHGEQLEPGLTLHRPEAEAFEYFMPRGHIITFDFDTSTKRCTGWHDLATAESFPCPDKAETTGYNQCVHCQRKTGFNPAFYNASSVSPQQQARNAQPHFLYLAHFAPGVVKVGISWAGRDIRRLLDQGARSALIVKEYPNANIARQYEAKISALPGIAENLQHKMKHRLLVRPYDTKAGHHELRETLDKIVSELHITPDPNQPLDLTPCYLDENSFNPHQLVQLSNNKISGKILGMIGGNIVAEQDSTPFFLNLSDFIGYNVEISSEAQQNQFAPQQVSLF